MISYTITACNEDKELDKLLMYLSIYVKEDDEVIVQLDSEKVTDGVRNVLEKRFGYDIKVIEFPLNNDFASFKNNLKNYCTKRWIFNIDADELPAGELLQNLYEILNLNETVDVLILPRWNIVLGIENTHIRKWGWKYDDYSRINWPDFQMRLYQNKPEIVWKNKVHEVLTGFESYATLPEEKEYCLFHNKTIERQEKQNEFYGSIQ